MSRRGIEVEVELDSEFVELSADEVVEEDEMRLALISVFLAFGVIDRPLVTDRPPVMDRPLLLFVSSSLGIGDRPLSSLSTVSFAVEIPFDDRLE